MVSEHESESGGPAYGGDRGGKSAGSEGRQGGKGKAEGEWGEGRINEQGGHQATLVAEAQPKADVDISVRSLRRTEMRRQPSKRRASGKTPVGCVRCRPRQ